MLARVTREYMSFLDQQRFFCLRGFMKSGTNWVGNLLNLHPQISCVGEFHWQTIYQALQHNLRTLPIMTEKSVRDSVRANFETMVKQSLVDVADEKASVIGDRNPHTINPIVIKNSPQITLIRDARDVLISRIFHLYNFPEVSRVFERFADMRARLEAFQTNPWYFREHPDELLCNEEVVRESMRWWTEHLRSDRQVAARHPGLRVLTLKYEDFHADIESTRCRMYEFLEVDATRAEDVPDYLMPVLDKERPNEFNRKGQIGDWKNYMTDQAKLWINEEAGEELIRNEYVQSLNW